VLPFHHQLPKRVAEDAIVDTDRNSQIELTIRLNFRKDITIQVVLPERQL
jgi:hypothetical protein